MGTIFELLSVVTRVRSGDADVIIDRQSCPGRYPGCLGYPFDVLSSVSCRDVANLLEGERSDPHSLLTPVISVHSPNEFCTDFKATGGNGDGQYE